MYKKILVLALAFVGSSYAKLADVNVVGYIKHANGLGRVTATWIDILSSSFDVTLLDTRPQFSSFEDIPENVKKIAVDTKKKPSKTISILTDNVWLPNFEPYKKIPKSTITLAYSMCESTKIPQPWVTILNKHFDGVIVPDSFLVAVYKNSGVTIPIFVLPLALYIDDFLLEPIKQARHTPFTFGVSAALSKNKNVALLVQAFAKEFGNNPNARLHIHSPWVGNGNEIESLIKKLNKKNIELSIASLSWKQYTEFMKSLDCYVLLSRGEGFSITVREAMALGLPCIISDNTAHRTICKSGLVYSVPSPIKQLSDREFYMVDVGYNFNCRITDVQKALREMYDHYDHYLYNGQNRRSWVMAYQPKNLASLYHTLIHPNKITLGKENKITAQELITNSRKLYQKYRLFSR